MTQGLASTSAEYDERVHVGQFFERNDQDQWVVRGIVVECDDSRNYISGDRGGDALYGGGGDDYINGSYGDDFLYGGAGDDILDGSWGNDVFVYRERDFGQDTIIGFKPGEDKIDFRGTGLSWSDLKFSNGTIYAGSGNQIVTREKHAKSDFLFGPAPSEEPHANADDRCIVALGSMSEVTEGGTAQVTVMLSQPSAEEVTVQWSTRQGWYLRYNVAEPEDYVAVSEPQTLTFRAGETRKTIEVDTVDDEIDEWYDHFTVVLSNPTGALLGADSTPVSIKDNDPPPEATIGDITVDEGDIATLTIELSHAREGNLTVYWATVDGTADGDDYSGREQKQAVEFKPGETSKSIQIDTTGDTDAEGDETFTVVLSVDEPFWPIGSFVTLGSKHTATVTIADDDAPPVVEPQESETVPSGTEPESEDPLPLGADDTLLQPNNGAEAAVLPRANLAGTMTADTMDGTSGVDTLDCLAGNDVARGLGGDDRLWGRLGADTLYGNAGDDCLWGNRGRDELHGGVGKDHLYGGVGDDTLYGGRGDDELHGGRRDDILSGGHGRDRFVYDDADFGRDRIVDFEDGRDLLDFTGSGLQWSDLSVSNKGKSHAVVRVEGSDSKIVLEGVDASLIGQDDFIF